MARKPKKRQAKSVDQSGSSAARPAHYDLDQIKSYARGQWPAILSQLGGIHPDLLDGNHHACPKCGGTDRFRMIDQEAGALLCNACFRTQNGDGFAALAWLTGRKFADVLALVADHLGIAPSATPYRSNGHSRHGKGPVDPAEHLSFQPWTEQNELLAAYWTLTKPPITVAAVKAVGGRIARYRGQYTVIALPVWGRGLDKASESPRPGNEQTNEQKPVGYSLYNITGGTLPKYGKRNPATPDKPAKVEWVKVKLTYGSRPGIIADLARLTSPDTATVWKTEGPSDLLAALSLPDLPADVAFLTNANGCGERPERWMLKLFTGLAARVIHDADEPGQRGALGHRDPSSGRVQHPGWAPAIASTASECRNVCLPYGIAPSHGQDLRDYLAAPHCYADLLTLAETAQPVAAAADADLPATVDPTDPNSPSVNAGQPLEDDDDPHRLARVNLDSYAAQADGATIRFWRSEYYTWKPSRACYRIISEDELRAKLTASIKAEFDRQWREDMAEYEAWRNSAEYDPDEDRDGPPKARKVTGHLVTNALNATASLTIIPSSVELMTWIGDGQRQRRPYIAMKNGLIDLDQLLADADESDCIFPHAPDWFSTVRLPYEFNPDATCPKFEAFLEKNLELDPERIKILQEWAGYCLTPDTGQQKFLAMEGEGSNGKSVFCAALTAMLGEENCSHVPLEKFKERFDKTNTLGKLVNICADVGEIDRVAEGDLKSFTSGDVMFFDRKHVGGMSCTPTARLVLSFNNRPRFSDRSMGVWRRMLLIPWQVQITEAERIPNMDKPWWWERSGELPGIFLWALKGLHRLRQQGRFTDSSLSKEALEDYRDESNPARCFLKEYFEASESSIRSSLVYHFYSKWCIQTGHKPMSDKIFGKEIKRVFPGIQKKRGGGRDERFWYYAGISFSTNEIFGEKTSDDTLF